MYVDEALERKLQLLDEVAGKRAIEKMQERNSKAMDMGLELCVDWMRESVGWNGLRIRETCKQVAVEAAEVCVHFICFLTV